LKFKASQEEGELIMRIGNSITNVADDISTTLENKVLNTSYFQGYNSNRQIGLYLGKKLLQLGNNLHFIPNKSTYIKLVQRLIDKSNEYRQYLFSWGQKFKNVCKNWSFSTDKEIKKCFREFAASTLKINNTFMELSKEFKETLVKEYNLCPICGKMADEDAIFCKYCGTKLKGRTRTIPKNIKKIVWERDGARCVECGNTEDLQFDHIIPFSKGGANTAENLQILCVKCNKKKFDKIDG